MTEKTVPSIDEIWSSIDENNQSETEDMEQAENNDKNLPSIDNFWEEEEEENIGQEQEQEEEEEVNKSTINRRGQTINKIKSSEDGAIKEDKKKSWLGSSFRSMGSGLFNTAAHLTRTVLDFNQNKYEYRDVIKEYGSIEKGLEAGDFRAVLASNYADSEETHMDMANYLKEIGTYIDPKVDTDIIKAVSEGRLADAGYGIVNGVARNVPDLMARGIILAKTGNPMLSTSHVFGSVAGGKQMELDNHLAAEDMSLEHKNIIAGTHGMIELLAERFGTTKFLEGMINNLGTKAAKGIVTEGIKDGLKSYLKAGFREGQEEALTEFSQSAADYIFGLNPEFSMKETLKFSLNAGIIGASSGLLMQGAGDISNQIIPAQEVDTSPKNEVQQDTISQQSKDARQILEATGDKTFDARVNFVQNMIDTGTEWALKYDINPEEVIALMGKESNFRNIDNPRADSTASGALQMTDAAMETVQDNYKLENDPQSMEGKIEAGVKYLHWIKENYNLSGDGLIAAYYAGAGEIIKNGIHDNKIYETEASPLEYLKGYHEILSQIKEIDSKTETTNEQQDTKEELSTEEEKEITEQQNEEAVTTEEKTHSLLRNGEITPESELFLEEFFNQESNPIELKNANGEWSQDALLEFENIRDEWGNPNDNIFTDNTQSEFTMEFKEALGEIIKDKTETLKDMGMEIDDSLDSLMKVIKKEGTPVENLEVNSEEVDIDEQRQQQQEEEGQQEQENRDRTILRSVQKRFERDGLLKGRDREYYRKFNLEIEDKIANSYEPIIESQEPTFKINDGEKYFEAISKSKEDNDYGAFVDSSNPEDLSNKDLYIYSGGAAGFAIESDGNIVNVFKNPKLSPKKGVAHEMLLQAIEKGGDRLDFFDGYLTKLYSRHGFVPVAKLKFNREYAPENWNYERDGEPYVVFAVHNGDSVDTVRTKSLNHQYGEVDLDNVPEVQDYETGKKFQAEAAIKRNIDNMDLDLEVEVGDTPPTSYFNENIELQTNINNELENLVKKYTKELAKHGIELTEEQKVKLMEIAKPAEGFAYNTTRVVEQNPEVLEVIQHIAEEVKSEPENTFEKIEDAAEESFGKEGKALQNELGLISRDAKVLSHLMDTAPEQVYKLKQIITNNAQHIQEYAQLLNDNLATLTELELATFAKRVATQYTLTNDLKNIESNWGRMGVAMRHDVNGKMVNLENIDPKLYNDSTDAQVKVRSLIDSFGGDKKLKELIAAIASGDKDLADINDTIRTSQDKKLMRALLENKMLSVLGDVNTHLSNIFSQFGNMILDNAINFNAATVNLFTKKDKGMTYGKAMAGMVEGFKGIIKSFHNPIVSLKDAGQTIFDKQYSTAELVALMFTNPSKFEQIREAAQVSSRVEVEVNKEHYLDSKQLINSFGENSTVINILRKTFDQINSFRRNLTFGGLQAGDLPFAHEGYYRQLGLDLYDLNKSLPDVIEGQTKQEYLSELKSQVLARRKIKTLEDVIEYRVYKEAENSSKEAMAKARNKIHKEIIGDTLDNVSPDRMKQIVELDKAAMEYSDKMTWKDPFEEGTAYRDFEKFLNRHPAAKVFGALFYHTPMKIFQKATNMTPLGKQFRRDISGKNGEAAQVQAYGALVTSVSLLTVAAALFASNKLTPTPRDKKERELMRQANVPPESIQINGKWYSYSRVEPSSTLLALGANGARAALEAAQDPEIEKSTDKILSVLGDTLLGMGQTLLNKSSLTGVLQTLNMLIQGGFEGYRKSTIDSMNPTYTLKNNFTDNKMFGLNPFYEEHLIEDSGLAARDMFGKRVTNYKSLGRLNPRTPTDSPIRQEIYDLDLKLSGFGSVFNGVELSDKQRNKVLEYFDEVIQAEDKMNKFVTSPTYKNLSTPQKMLEIEKRWNSLKTQAQIRLVRDSQFMEELKELKEEEKEQFLNNYDYPKEMFRDKEKLNKVKDIVETINLFKSGD